METRELICINCPLGCMMKVEMDRTSVVSVSGNTCKRGEVYARKEVVSPTRTVTSTVAVKGGVHPVVAVKTASDIPKSKIFDVMAEINRACAEAPVSIGDVIIENVCGTEVNVVTTANMSKV
ncbi:MAG: DUF1667 domain-containing protein [Clostridia bacterium]|nr:DUF1667 domain-containing protein [Clostridia bacterium]